MTKENKVKVWYVWAGVNPDLLEDLNNVLKAIHHDYAEVMLLSDHRKAMEELRKENERLSSLVYPSGKNLTILQLRQQIDDLKQQLQHAHKEIEELRKLKECDLCQGARYYTNVKGKKQKCKCIKQNNKEGK
jgi:hypothetical protein